MEFDLQRFADAGTLVNTTTGTANAYTGATTADGGMSASMKTYYDTELLENARPNLVFSQLGRKQSLPAHHGKTVEWRKFDTFDKALTPLTEGVIPTGKKLTMTSTTVAVQQFGDYTTISDQLDMHAVDPVILGATEEMGAAAGATADTLVRNVLMTGTNVMYAPNGSTAVTARASLTAACKLTPDVVHKAVTWLKKCKAPKFDGRWYVAVIHPSVAYDLTSSTEWLEAHKYAATTEIFAGEIGQLRGCRFIESTEAPIIAGGSGNAMVYATLFFGKNAFGVVDPEGMNLELIVKDKSQVGGPLNQFSTVGYKFEAATKILYQERMVRVESGSSYSATDSAN
ncbi:MAG: N4-gp56 family major capsid protein [Faecousia sp.]